jgi:hypothetical protein
VNTRLLQSHGLSAGPCKDSVIKHVGILAICLFYISV